MPNRFDPPAGGNAPLSSFANASTRPTRAKVQTFLSSGTWTCPANVFWITLEMCGGGGGGGGSNGSSAQQIAANGGAGAVAVMGTVPVVPGTIYTMTVGAGGAGGSGGTWNGSDSTNGSAGGTSSMIGNDGLLRLYALGGTRGLRVTSSSSPQPAAAAAPLTADFVNRFGLPFVNGGIGGRGGNSSASTTRVDGGSVESVPAGVLITPGFFYDDRGSGPGGASAFGRGADSVVLTNSPGYGTGRPGNTATEFGGGGGGGAGGFDASTGTSAAGGTGGPGVIRIQWEE